LLVTITIVVVTQLKHWTVEQKSLVQIPPAASTPPPSPWETQPLLGSLHYGVRGESLHVTKAMADQSVVEKA